MLARDRLPPAAETEGRGPSATPVCTGLEILLGAARRLLSRRPVCNFGILREYSDSTDCGTVAVVGMTFVDVSEVDRGVPSKLLVQETTIPSIVATTMSGILLASTRRLILPEENGTALEGTLGYAVPE